MNEKLVKDVAELKEFILWARDHQIGELQIDGVIIHFNPKAFMDDNAKAAMAKTLAIVQDPKSQEISLDNQILFDAGL